MISLYQCHGREEHVLLSKRETYSKAYVLSLCRAVAMPVEQSSLV